MKRFFLLLLFSVSSAYPQAQNFPGAGGVSPNSPVPAASAQGPRFNVKNYGAIGDAQHVVDGVTAGSSGHTVTSATAQFKTTDVGKKIVCAAGANATPLMPISTITVRNSATQVTVGGAGDNGAAGSLKCVWYTADDTAAFQATNTAAQPSIASVDPNGGATLGTPPGTVYCPEGGYAVSGRIFSFAGAGNSIGPSFVGAGVNKCIIYILPGTVDPNDGFGVLMSFYNGVGAVYQGFSVDGLAFGFSFTHPVVEIQSSQLFMVDNVKVTNVSISHGTKGTVDFNGSSNGETTNLFVQGAGSGNDFACGFAGGAQAIVNKNITCSNHNQNIDIGGGTGVRTVFGDNGVVFEGGLIDECGSGITNCTVVASNGLAHFYGTVFLQGSSAANYALSVDGTSRAYLSNVSCGVYGSIGTASNCMTIASGGFVTATNSDLRGNGTGVAVNGPAGATFVDLGGNKILTSTNGTITPVTAATYATLGFTGGIVPKAAITHTPNTCYAVTGNLLATAQNLCTFLNDQNYQILNITAQSGGNAPANSACATPPVITFSDGTRTATLTMTTAKTQWSSAVDTVTNLNQVFASGTTLTVSIGANTCATPPVNVAVSYVLQSVLNP